MATKKTQTSKTAAKKAPAKKAPAKTAAKKAPVNKTATKKASKKVPAKTAAKKAPKKAPAKTAAKKAPKKAPAKTAAKKAPVNKTATKKAAAKTATKKAPAKTAAKKAPAKTAAKKAPAKTAAKKAPAKTAAKEAPAKKTYPFDVGDKVVYPHHGAATIIKKERIDFAGEVQDYFVLQIATDQLTLRVPAASAVERGVRPVISRNKARQVFAVFKEEPQEAGANWSRWYKLLTEKINSGDIFQVAEVVRDLTYAQQVKGISPALKRMLAKARLIIVSELQFSLELPEEDTIKKLDRALPKVDEPVDA